MTVGSLLTTSRPERANTREIDTTDDLASSAAPGLMLQTPCAPDLSNRNKLTMTKLGISVGILAAAFCLSASAQTINVMTLDQAGAQTVLQAARESAQQRNAPSAIAVVDPTGDLLAFQRMDGVRPASAELAIEKARTAARLQRPTAEIEENINQGRTAFVTAGIAAACRYASTARSWAR